MLRFAASILVVSIVVSGASAHAQPPAEFYRGKQIKLVVGTAAGQDYDLWARLIGRHITRQTKTPPRSRTFAMLSEESRCRTQFVWSMDFPPIMCLSARADAISSIVTWLSFILCSVVCVLFRPSIGLVSGADQPRTGAPRRGRLSAHKPHHHGVTSDLNGSAIDGSDASVTAEGCGFTLGGLLGVVDGDGAGAGFDLCDHCLVLVCVSRSVFPADTILLWHP